MIETLSITEFEGATVLLHKKENGFKQAIIMNGEHKGEVAELGNQPKIEYVNETFFGTVPNTSKGLAGRKAYFKKDPDTALEIIEYDDDTKFARVKCLCGCGTIGMVHISQLEVSNE